MEAKLTILKGTVCSAIPPASIVLLWSCILTICFAIDITSTKGDTLCLLIPTFSETEEEDHKENALASGLNKFGNILCPIVLTAILMFGNLSEYMNGFTELGNKMDMNWKSLNIWCVTQLYFEAKLRMKLIIIEGTLKITKATRKRRNVLLTFLSRWANLDVTISFSERDWSIFRWDLRLRQIL